MHFGEQLYFVTVRLAYKIPAGQFEIVEAMPAMFRNARVHDECCFSIWAMGTPQQCNSERGMRLKHVFGNYNQNENGTFLPNSQPEPLTV